MPGGHWSEDEIDYIRANWLVQDDWEMGRHLGRSANAVSKARRVHRLVRGGGARPIENFNAVVRENWEKLPTVKIAKMLGVSPKAVAKRAARMGLPPRAKVPAPPRSRAEASARAQEVLATHPDKPKGFSAEQRAWARAAANVNREAAMIAAMSGQDVRRFGWR